MTLSNMDVRLIYAQLARREGLTYTKLAKKVGVDFSQVTAFIRNDPSWPVDDAAYNAIMSFFKVKLEEYGRKRSPLSLDVKELRTAGYGVRIGSVNKQNPFVTEVSDYIEKLQAEGADMTAVAKKIGVSRQVVYDLAHHRSKHLIGKNMAALHRWWDRLEEKRLQGDAIARAKAVNAEVQEAAKAVTDTADREGRAVPDDGVTQSEEIEQIEAGRRHVTTGVRPASTGFAHEVGGKDYSYARLDANGKVVKDEELPDLSAAQEDDGDGHETEGIEVPFVPVQTYRDAEIDAMLAVGAALDKIGTDQSVRVLDYWYGRLKAIPARVLRRVPYDEERDH